MGQELRNLINQWERIAERKVYDASREKENEMGRRLIMNGAPIYHQCVSRLTEALSLIESELRATSEGEKK